MKMNKNFQKLAVILFASVLSVTLFAVSASAEGAMPEGYGDFAEAVPDDAAKVLPDGIFSDDPDEVSRALLEAAEPANLLRAVLDWIGGGIGGALKLFVVLTGITVICAVGNAGEGIVSPGMSEAVSYAAGLGAVVTGAGLQFGKLSALSAYLGTLRTVMLSLLPLMSALYLSGGNAGTAALNNTTLVMWLDIIDTVLTGYVVPAVCVCTALAAADIFTPAGMPGLSPVSSLIKRSIIFVLGLGGTLLAAALSAQTVLTAAADSVGARTVKFISGSMIPVVGGTVGDTLRTVASTVKIMKGTVGTAGIIVIGATVLPTLISLWLTRFAYSSAAAVGEALGGKKEVKFMNEMASLYGYLLAATAICALLFVFALTVFALTGTAVGDGL